MLRFTLLLALLLFVPCCGRQVVADGGEGLGASHQTGWTSLIVRLVRQRIERKQGRKVKD